MDIQRAKELARALRTVPLTEPHQVRLRELCDIIDPPERMVEPLPREHRTRQESGFAMIAPTDWIETTERWHARCEAHRRAVDYKWQIESALDAVHQQMLARDCIEWIEHQTEMHILRVIADALGISWPTSCDTFETYSVYVANHVGARYA